MTTSSPPAPRRHTYRTPKGRHVECELSPDPVGFPTATPLPSRLRCVPAREHGDAGERPVLWLRVPPELPAAERAVALAELDNEVLAGQRLADVARLNGAATHPPEVSRLLGHNDDPEHPFALLEPYRGEPVADLFRERQLFDEERAAFVSGLLCALAWTEAAGVVHRGVQPHSVRWVDGRRQVQLTGFTRATVAGAHRTPIGERPWASRQQFEGTGGCDTRDDLWGAALLLFQALTGTDVERLVARGESRVPLERHPDVAERFATLLDDDAERRPSAIHLLRDTVGAAPVRTTLAATLAPGRAAFRAERHRKHPGPVATASPDPEPPSEPPSPGPAAWGAATEWVQDISRRLVRWVRGQPVEVVGGVVLLVPVLALVVAGIALMLAGMGS